MTVQCQAHVLFCTSSPFQRLTGESPYGRCKSRFQKSHSKEQCTVALQLQAYGGQRPPVFRSHHFLSHCMSCGGGTEHFLSSSCSFSTGEPSLEAASLLTICFGQWPPPLTSSQAEARLPGERVHHQLP